MEGFTVADFSARHPKESGSYLVVIYSRDNKPILRVMNYDSTADHGQKWITVEVDEYGYFTYHRSDPDFIHAYRKIDGVHLEIVPEVVSLNIPSLPAQED